MFVFKILILINLMFGLYMYMVVICLKTDIQNWSLTTCIIYMTYQIADLLKVI
jgi:hypothetical protein